MKLDVNNPDDLIALFAHDLKGTMGSVQNFADMLENSGELNEAQQKWMSRIYANVTRGLKMIEDMVTLSQMGSQIIDASLNDIRPLIHDALSHMESLILERNAIIQIDIGIDADRVFCDPVWFRHVLYNLLSNAVKYNEDEGSVYITTWHGRNAVFIRITDTGMGIPPEAVPHVFDKFYRVRSGPSEGSGLGLAIVREIVERHGGSISVESTLGQGTSFILRMPIPGASKLHESGEELDALDDDSQEEADYVDYDDPLDQ